MLRGRSSRCAALLIRCHYACALCKAHFVDTAKRMRLRGLVLFLLYCTACVDSQTVPYFSHGDTLLAHHSYVNISVMRIGHDRELETGLLCNTDLSTCCAEGQGNHRGDWYFPNGERLPFDSLLPMYERRGPMMVGLFRRHREGNSTLMEGLYECRIDTHAVNTDAKESAYIGLYHTANNGNSTIIIIL